MLGGAHRGPVAPGRQRRTIRLVQLLLVLLSGGLMMFAGYSLGRVHGYDLAQQGSSFDRPRQPSLAQPLVLVVLGGVTILAAGALGGGGTVRVPTPARLDEFVDRAERAAIERAEKSAENPEGQSATTD